MIGDVAATVDLVEGDSARGKQLVGGENVGAVGVAAQSQHRRMLEQEQHVSDAVLLAQRDQLLLQAQGFGVVNAAEIEVVDHA